MFTFKHWQIPPVAFEILKVRHKTSSYDDLKLHHPTQDTGNSNKIQPIRKKGKVKNRFWILTGLRVLESGNYEPASVNTSCLRKKLWIGKHFMWIATGPMKFKV
jgi:hypothetical protein